MSDSATKETIRTQLGVAGVREEPEARPRASGSDQLADDPFLPPGPAFAGGRELTLRALAVGSLLGIIFGASSLYLVLADTAALHKAGKAGPYRGRDLRLASEWRRKFRPSRAWVSSYHPGYADALRFLEESRRHKRRAVSFYVAVVAAIALVAYYPADLQRRFAESGRLAATSREELANDPLAALRLAVNAVNAAPTNHAEQALRNALFASEQRLLFSPVAGPDGRSYGAVSASLSPDGKYVAAARADNRPLHIYAWSYFRDSAELLKEAERFIAR